MPERKNFFDFVTEDSLKSKSIYKLHVYTYLLPVSPHTLKEGQRRYCRVKTPRMATLIGWGLLPRFHDLKFRPGGSDQCVIFKRKPGETLVNKSAAK